MHSVIGQPMLLTPGRRVTVQLRRLAGLLLQQASAEQVGEQLVVTPPATHLIQRHKEQARPLHLLQHHPAARARPVTGSHSAPDSRSRTEVSNRKLRTSSGWRSSTSPAR